MSERLDRLRALLPENKIDALLVSSPENRRYLSGFTGTAGYLVVSAGHAVLATDFRYVEQAEDQAPGFRIHRIGGGPSWLPKLAAELGLSRLGFESYHVTVAAHEAFRKAIQEEGGDGKPALVPTGELVDELRAYKDSRELALITKAVEIADQAFDQVGPTVQPGVREDEVAWELEKAMRERGADSVSFDIIVGAGPNGALPHHRAGDRVVREGEAVVVDMGARYRGYCSDLTRTIFVGEPDETFGRVYGAVLRAQRAAQEQVRAGMTGKEVDAIARDIITEAGYGDNFGHSLGHGVGLAVHEYPGVGPKSEKPLQDGMVFTIEPGIYLSGWGGVRIEDIVVLEKGLARTVSRAKKLTL